MDRLGIIFGKAKAYNVIKKSSLNCVHNQSHPLKDSSADGYNNYRLSLLSFSLGQRKTFITRL